MVQQVRRQRYSLGTPFLPEIKETYVHSGKCFTGLLTMTVDNVCYDTGGTKLHSQVDQAHTNHNC